MSDMSFVAAADTTNMQAGGASFFDNTADLMTKGITGAVVSGLYGIANTGVDLSNKVFGTEIDHADTATTLGSIDDGYAQYYKDHKEAIDVAGFVAGSLIPGGLAVKGLKMVQTGNAAGAFSRVLGYTTRMESMYLNKALGELATEGGTIFTRISAAKSASMAWGVADNVLQMAAFEVAVAASMKSSPMLEDKEWKDIGWDIVKSSMIGGAIGGGLNALFTNKLVKDAGLLVEGKQRMYDVLKATGDIDVSFGDKAFGLSDAILSLPKEVLDPSVKLTHGRKDLLQSLDLTPLLERTLGDSVKRGMTKFETALANVSVTDPTIGLPLAKSFVSIAKEGIEAGESNESIRKKLGDLLFNLQSVEGIAGKPLNVAGELLYLNPKADIFSGKLMTQEKQAGDFAYRVIGDQSKATMGTLGNEAATKDALWKKGFDFALDPQTKTITVSPFSTIYQRIKASEADYTPMFYNTVTRRTSLDTVPTIGDMQTAAVPIVANSAGVVSGTESFAFKTGIYNEPANTIEATARHYWASKLTKVFGEVDVRDISVLDALLKNPSIAAPELTLVDRVKPGNILFADLLRQDRFESFVFNQKYTELNRRLTESTLAQVFKKSDLPPLASYPAEWTVSDLRDIAYRLNVDAAWIDRGISQKLESAAMRYNAGTTNWIRDQAVYGERENLLFRYDTKSMDNAAAKFPDAITAYYERVKEAQTRLTDVADAQLGLKHANLLPDIRESLTAAATSQTAGATYLGASNANYFDRLKSAFQYIGQQTGLIKNERRTAALTELQNPMVRVLQNPEASAEIAAALQAGRRPPVDPETGKLISWSLFRDPVSGDYKMVDLGSFLQYKETGKMEFKKVVPLTQDAGDFLNTFHSLHEKRVDAYNALYAAHGMARNYPPERLHFPPVDTQRVPFFAFVRQSDGTIFGSSDVAMITARDAGELQKKAAQVEAMGLHVQYKDNTEAYFKAKREYDHAMTMNSPAIDSALRSKGMLGDFMPNFTPEAVMEDFVQYTQRSEGKLASDLIEAKYAQTFTELKDLSNRYTAGQTSKFEGLSRLLQKSVTDPFGDTIKLALNISKRSEFTLWHEANEFVDALGVRAFRGAEQAFLDAREGKINFEDANAHLAKFGLSAPFRDEDAFIAAKAGQDRNLLKTAIHKANSIIAAGMLRLDFANSLLNMISTPITLGMEVSSIRNSLRKDPELFAKFNSQLQEVVPDTALVIPSTTRLIANAIAALAKGNSHNEFMQRFRAIGAVKGQAAIFHDMIDELSLTPKLIPSEYAAKVDKWVEKGATWTGNNMAEDSTRFVTSHVMMQITDPLVAKGAMTIQEQNAYISIFTNRVQGNYIASQRPMIFQGTIGAAIGLFQTYQFNMFQQLLRHIENRDMKTIAIAGALQGTLFGANGLPFFQAINTHIIGSASINAGHKDAYSYATQAIGKQYGDWLMYGTASAFPLFSEQAPALWTRGDLNPRGTFVIPTSPLDVPAIGASLKVVNAVLGMAQQVSKGSNMKDALLFGLEHNGVNRPLAGLAQVLSGNVTTSKGNLIAASGDWLSIATASRLLGAKPMDESIALNTMYRSSAYQAMDKERLDALGTVVKQKSRNGEPITQEDWIDFQGQYAASGGRIQGFGAAMRRWDKAAKTSLVDEMMKHSQTAAGQRLNEAMGGDPLRDYAANAESPTP
jgi:uncharacterized membrane protein YjjB (DUF3815 family)